MHEPRERGGLAGFRLVVPTAAALAAGVIGEWAYARTGVGPFGLVRDVAVGWLFAGVGLFAWRRWPAFRTGALMYAEGMTWFIGNLQGTSVPALVAVGCWLEALNLAVLAHLLLSYPEGTLADRASRAVVASGYGLTIAGGLIRAMVHNPATGRTATYLSCPTCGPNALAVLPDPALFDAIDLGYRALGGLLTLACAALLVQRWRRSSPPRRRVLLPVGAAIAIAVMFIGFHVASPAGPGGSGPVATALLLASDTSQAMVPIAFAMGLLRLRLRRSVVSRLVVEIGTGPAPERLQQSLVRVLGDPSVRLGLWTDKAGGYVGTDGGRLPPAGEAQDATYVDCRGEPAAVLHHDPALDPELLAAVVAAVRLGLENAALRAEISARSAESDAVGRRVVEAAVAERRRIERDLHDGAQQRLFVALLAVRRVQAGLPAVTDSALRGTVAEAGEAVRVALSELRDLAHGLYPAVLSREGLRSAVTGLAERAPVPVAVAVEPRRLPPLVEATAYFTICEALTNVAKHAHATKARVRVRRDGDSVLIQVTDDGVGGADPAAGTGLRGLRDRLAAVGGSLDVVSPVGRGTRLEAQVPCE